MEKKYWLWLFIVAVTFFGGTILGFYLCKQYYGDIETQIQFLKSNPKDIKLEEVKLLIDKSNLEIKQQYDLAIKFGLPLSIAALLASIFGAYKWAAEMAKEEAKKAMRSDEDIIRQERNIIVLGKENGDRNDIVKYLRNANFDKVSDDKWEEGLELKDYDLVFIHNFKTDSSFTNEEVARILALSKSNAVIFSFGKISGSGQLEQALVDNPRVNSALFKSQIYGNLLNALKYQQQLRRNS
jgi:uncharacterized protein YneF (UPF0154 family)